MGAADYPALLAMLKRHEGLRLKPYVDTVGRLTIGYGRNLDAKGISDAEAGILLGNDAAAAITDLEHFGARQAALVDLAFNVGKVGFRKFTRMIAAIEAGDFDRAAAELLDSSYARQVGRRADELAELLRLGAWPGDV